MVTRERPGQLIAGQRDWPALYWVILLVAYYDGGLFVIAISCRVVLLIVVIGLWLNMRCGSWTLIYLVNNWNALYWRRAR